MAAFFDGFVCSVIHNGKPLREFSENGKRTVKIPFDSEYKLRLKSNGRRALVNVEIDGTDVLCGKQLILNWNDTIDLERFVDSFSSGKKFKFVPLSNSGVQDPTSPENGKIKITFHPERQFYLNHTFTISNPNPDPFGGVKYGSTSRGMSTGASYDASSASASLNSTPTMSHDAFTVASASPAGATVEGGDSSQQFYQGVGFETDLPIVMEIWMRGAVQEEVVNPRYVVRIKSFAIKQNGDVPQLWLENPYRAVIGAQVLSVGDVLKFKVGPTEFTTKDFVVKYE